MSRWLLGYHKKKQNLSTISDGVDFITATICQFGVHELDTSQLIQFAKIILVETSNPGIKKAITALLCELYKYVGNKLRDTLAKDIKPALLSALNKEFDKLVGHLPHRNAEAGSASTEVSR